jgi:type II secretory pathway pseudopilin PulG
MKRIRSILRGQEGMTLVELVVGAGLLCLVIGIFSASLRPAAEVSQELNNAELIADDLLETVRSKVETATDYIKCYDSGTDVTNKTGSSEGSAIEFGYETEQGYNAAELLTADGCGPTKIVIADKDSGEQPQVEKGYLVERYYKDGYSQDADGNPIARAMTKTYAEGFYMGLRAGLYFKIDEAKHTVTATVTIYRDKDLTDKIYSDSLIIDLRYDIPVKTEVTATKKPA